MMRFGVILLSIWLFPTLTIASDDYQRVQVADPYLELHTGAGRGFPVFFVVERGENVEILKRKTDWFKIRTTAGKEGWVSRDQLERTLTDAGIEKTFRDILVEDYLARRLEVGFAGGIFESDPLVLVRVGWRLTPNLLAEVSGGQTTGNFSSSTLYSVNILSEPFADKRIAPFFTLGAGKFRNTPNTTLVGAQDSSSFLANAGFGVRAYLTRRFIFRADFKTHLVLVGDNRTDSYREWSTGFSFFF